MLYFLIVGMFKVEEKSFSVRRFLFYQIKNLYNCSNTKIKIKEIIFLFNINNISYV
jgi:hypothetical protein